MSYFLYKLIPSRPTFAQDKTEPEGKLMQEHVDYWTALVNKGTAMIFGPVADPKGVWGIAILESEDAATVHAIGMSDPIINSKIGFRFEVYPMPGIVMRK